MKTRLLFIFLLIQFICKTQTDSVDKRYYRDGHLKFVATWKGKDTIQFIKYYRNGQMKDSVWLYIPNGKEIPLGTEKTYFENGKLSSVSYYKNGYDEYIYYRYYENGSLRRFEQNPTGLLKTYNKKGEQVSEADFHKSKEIFVSKNFRKGRHLKNTNYEIRIKTKKAWLTDAKKKHRLSTGTLVSLKVTSDTLLLTQCQIEGFSKDSIYFSKFHYNANYFRGSGFNILKLDSTFSLGCNQLEAIYYAKHKNRKRTLGAEFAIIGGIEFVLFPVVLLVILPIGGATLVETLIAYSVMAVPGTGFYFLGKRLLKTTVPKRYDMNKYKIYLKT